MSYAGCMTTAKAIISRIGHAKLSQLLGVGETAIYNSATAGSFPAKWFWVIRSECDHLEIDCPERLFNFVSPSVSGRPRRHGGEAA